MVFIENTVEELSNIYQQKAHGDVDTTECILFSAISKYFKSCLKKICDTQKVHIDDLYFIFIAPNEWSTKSEMALLVLIPLLENMGVIFHQNPLDRVFYTTQLEASLSYLQLNPQQGQSIPAFVQNTNQCILYNVGIEDEAVQQQSIYFQLKESLDLELFKSGRFYIPKVVAIEENHQDNCMIDFDFVKNSLQQMVFAQVLGGQLNTVNSIAVDRIRDGLLDTIEVIRVYISHSKQ